MYKIKEINYNSNLYLNEYVIYYHKILYKGYLDRLNALLTKNNHNFNMPKEDIVNNLEIFPIEERGNILFNLGGVLNHELYFDSISPKQIKDELQVQGFKIEKNQIDNSKQISSLGFHNVEIALYPGVTATIKVHLVKWGKIYG